MYTLSSATNPIPAIPETTAPNTGTLAADTLGFLSRVETALSYPTVPIDFAGE